MPALVHTYAEYLGFEASSNVKHEFIDGQIYAMAGPREIDGVDAFAITNPALIVEVLSRSTEEHDSGDKFEHYKTFPILREYVLVSHCEHSVEVRSRGEDGWRTTVVPEVAIAELSIGARLDVRELYAAAAEPTG